MNTNQAQKLQQRNTGEFFFEPRDRQLLAQKNIWIDRNREGKILVIKKVKKAFSGYVGEPFGCTCKEDPYVPSGTCIKFNYDGSKVSEIGNLYSECHRCVDDDIIWLWKSYYSTRYEYHPNGNIVSTYKSSPKEKLISLQTLDKDVVAVLKEEGLFEKVAKTLIDGKKFVTGFKKAQLSKRNNVRE